LSTVIGPTEIVPEESTGAAAATMVSWWPKRKPPLLHRVLGEENNEESLEQLATKRRVRKRDTFHRNALHVAVRKSECYCMAVPG
jgi:hypothetical protein